MASSSIYLTLFPLLMSREPHNTEYDINQLSLHYILITTKIGLVGPNPQI